MGKEGYYQCILSWVDLRWHNGGNEVCMLPSELFGGRGNFYTFSSLIWAGHTCDRIGRMGVSSPKHKIAKTMLLNHRTHFRLRSAQHKLMACIAPISAAENYPLIFHITQPWWLCIFMLSRKTLRHTGKHMPFGACLFHVTCSSSSPAEHFMIRYDRVSLFTFWP